MQLSPTNKIRLTCKKQIDSLGVVSFLPPLSECIGQELGTVRDDLIKAGFKRFPSGSMTAEAYRQRGDFVTIEIFLMV